MFSAVQDWRGVIHFATDVCIGAQVQADFCAYECVYDPRGGTGARAWKEIGMSEVTIITADGLKREAFRYKKGDVLTDTNGIVYRVDTNKYGGHVWIKQGSFPLKAPEARYLVDPDKQLWDARNVTVGSELVAMDGKRYICTGNAEQQRVWCELQEGKPEPVAMKAEAHNPKHAAGLSKCPLHLVPPVAIIREAEVFKLGAKKYGAHNWRSSAVVRSIYIAAALRHLYAMADGQDIDPESGQPHSAHVRACMAILLDAAEIGKLVDDRPPNGNAAAVLASLTEAATKH